MMGGRIEVKWILPAKRRPTCRWTPTAVSQFCATPLMNISRNLTYCLQPQAAPSRGLQLARFFESCLKIVERKIEFDLLPPAAGWLGDWVADGRLSGGK